MALHLSENPVIECSEEYLQTSATLPENHGYSKSVIRFKNGSRWKIKEPLSERRYQQANLPFEARQVFACVCLEDPNGRYRGIQEAVMKVKYQVTGDDDIIKYYEDGVEDCVEREKREPGARNAAWDIRYARRLLYEATHPVGTPNYFTHGEIRVLHFFGGKKCACAPHLLAYAEDCVDEGVDSNEMVDGFAAFTLMTKLPGRRIRYDDCWSLSLSKREEIREAFKKAFV